jgi:hypothetical protein
MGLAHHSSSSNSATRHLAQFTKRTLATPSLSLSLSLPLSLSLSDVFAKINGRRFPKLLRTVNCRNRIRRRLQRTRATVAAAAAAAD